MLVLEDKEIVSTAKPDVGGVRSSEDILNAKLFAQVIGLIGMRQFQAAEKAAPGLVEQLTAFCCKTLSPNRENIMNSLNGVNSAAGVITSSSLFYLPMDTVPFGQKLIALGPGGCGAFEQISHKNVDSYYGWVPMPKVPADNPIRMQYKGMLA